MPMKVLRRLVAAEIRDDAAGAVFVEDPLRDHLDDREHLRQLCRVRLEERQNVPSRNNNDMRRVGGSSMAKG